MDKSLFGMEKALQSALYRGVNFLQQSQLPSGEFRTYLSNNSAMEGSCVYDSSPFATTIVLHGLQYVQEDAIRPYVESMQNNAYAFFLREMEPPGLWRYWTSQSGKLIAPDLDDTCCISFLLSKAGLGNVYFDNQQIIKNNRSRNGLFLTWFQDYVEKNDIDSVVNANVLLYLGFCPETEDLCHQLVQIIMHDLEEQTYWYYLDNIALYYAISRAYREGVRLLAPAVERIIEKVRSCREFDNEIAAALMVSTLINLDYWDEVLFSEAAEYLLTMQNQAGFWRRIAYYVGPEPPIPHRAWFGSEELTTGLCIEAIARLRAGL